MTSIRFGGFWFPENGFYINCPSGYFEADNFFASSENFRENTAAVFVIRFLRQRTSVYLKISCILRMMLNAVFIGIDIKT